MAGLRAVPVTVCLALYAALVFAAPARAGCAHGFQVPISPIGQSVTINGQAVGGVYPELLKRVVAKMGCEIAFTPVPRARQEAMYENGQADLLVPASRTPRRDRYGYFIPLILSRAALVSIDAKHAPVHSVAELLERHELRVALVRGFDYGEAYTEMARQLSKQGRVFLEVDPLSVARLLSAGFADVTVMSPIVFAGALQGDARVASLLGKLRIEQMQELPWGESGVYISKTSVAPEDRAALERGLSAAVKSGDVWDGFKRYYSPEVLSGSAKAR